MKLTLNILVVNLNNLRYTQDCIDNLLKQNRLDFKLTLIDQNSFEEGTLEYLNSLEESKVEVIKNDTNKPLNHVWNEFTKNAKEDLLCFLNNDVVINSNFVSDLFYVFENENNVGIAVHSTNHPHFNKVFDTPIYRVLAPFKFMQGWDFTIRRKLFTPIPESIKIYCGDDFLFNSVYEQGFTLAYIISSPMIHLEGQSKKFMSTSGVEDIEEFKRLGHRHYLKVNQKYSKIKPQFSSFRKANWLDRILIKFK